MRRRHHDGRSLAGLCQYMSERTDDFTPATKGVTREASGPTLGSNTSRESPDLFEDEPLSNSVSDAVTKTRKLLTVVVSSAWAGCPTSRVEVFNFRRVAEDWRIPIETLGINPSHHFDELRRS